MHATRDAAIFLRPAKSTGANRSFFAFEKLPIKAESAREGEVNTIGALWSVNRATLRHNYSFWQLPFPVALMARYCMHEEITPCEYNIALEGERERRKRGEIYETKYQIENMKTITNLVHETAPCSPLQFVRRKAPTATHRVPIKQAAITPSRIVRTLNIHTIPRFSTRANEAQSFLENHVCIPFLFLSLPFFIL